MNMSDPFLYSNTAYYSKCLHNWQQVNIGSGNVQLTLRTKYIKNTQKSEDTHWFDLSLEMPTLHQFTINL